MIPREASRLIVLRFWISPSPKGPMIIPAISWPTTTGCLIFEKRKLKPKAANTASPRSNRKPKSAEAVNWFFPEAMAVFLFFSVPV